jgi:hypothetical protein
MNTKAYIQKIITLFILFFHPLMHSMNSAESNNISLANLSKKLSTDIAFTILTQETTPYPW